MERCRMNDDDVKTLSRTQEMNEIERDVKFNITEATALICNLITNYVDDYTPTYQDKLLAALNKLIEAKRIL
jgi:hypothetical protein